MTPSPDEETTHAPQAGAEALAEPLRSRWSPSIFDDRHVLDPGDLRTLLHAAQWSPSWGNTQPWAFVVVERGSGAHLTLVEHLTRGNAGWVPRASAVVLTVARIGPDADGKAARSPENAYYDLGQAAAHLTLQARAMGLHAHQFGGFDHEGLTRALGVPDDHRLVSGIAIGRRGDPADVSERDRDREQKPRVRRDLDDLVHGGAWGRTWPGRPVPGAS